MLQLLPAVIRGQAQLPRRVGSGQVAGADTDEADPHALQSQLVHQDPDLAVQLRRIVDGVRQRHAARHGLEVGVPQLEGDGPRRRVVLSQASCHPFAQPEQLPPEVFGVVHIGVEGLLGTHAPGGVGGLDGPGVTPPGQLGQLRGAGVTDQPAKGVGRQLLQLPHRADAECLQPLGGLGPHTPQVPHRQRRQVVGDIVLAKVEQPVGLGLARTQLGQELVGCHADTCHQRQLLEYPRPHQLTDDRGGPNSLTLPRTSRNASSSDSGSTTGVTDSKISRICFEIAV